MNCNLKCFLVLAILAASSGCEDRSEPKTVDVGKSTQSAPADSLESRYRATLAEGIDFRKPDYPDFLAEVSGMSAPEEWGRWTDANAGPVAKFRFKQPLPKRFTLSIMANAFGPNLGEPVKIRVGAAEKLFIDKDPNTIETYRFDFDLADSTDTIEIIPPRPISPAELSVPESQDTRKLGVGLVTLKIE